MCEKAPSEAELAGLGLTLDDVTDEISIYPDNQRAFELFYFMRTQWRIGMAGATGLDYNVLYHKLQRLKLSSEEADDVEWAIQIMESEALDLMNQRDD